MKNDEFKKMLSTAWMLEKELRDFCAKAIREIFKEDAPLAIDEFEDMVATWEDYGALQDIGYLRVCVNDRKENIEIAKRRAEDYKRQQEEKNNNQQNNP